MNTTAVLISGYRGRKVHAVDVTVGRNIVLARTGDGIALCGWGVELGEVPFSDMGCLSCRACAKAAAR